jgi:hypothetical protein
MNPTLRTLRICRVCRGQLRQTAPRPFTATRFLQIRALGGSLSSLGQVAHSSPVQSVSVRSYASRETPSRARVGDVMEEIEDA